MGKLGDWFGGKRSEIWLQLGKRPVASLSHRIRLLCAYNPAVCRAIGAIFVRAIANTYLAFCARYPLPPAIAVHSQLLHQ